MRGSITTYDKRKCEGRVQGDDGHIYFFAEQDIDKDEEKPYFMVDMEAEFEPSERDGKLVAKSIYLLNPDSYEDKCKLYIEPEEFLTVKDDLVDGYDVLDRGLYAIYRGDRTEEKARNRLINECVSLGANAVVSYSVEEKLKSAFGNGYMIYTARGVPVVLGKPDANGEVTAEDLKHRLDQEKVKKNHNIMVNTKIGRMVIQGLAAVLLIICTIGFIMSGGI